MAKKLIVPSEYDAYVASFSGGKDSLAMVLRLIREGHPLTHVVMFDTGMEYESVLNAVEWIRPKIEAYGAKLVILRPKQNVLFTMLLKTVNNGKPSEHYGFDWCGGCCRWRTKEKISAIEDFLRSLDGEIIQYIGIAADESERLKPKKNVIYPLAEWKMTEKDCLQYCYDAGFYWEEGGIRLYDHMSRLSCYDCTNHRIGELRFLYSDSYMHDRYWNVLKGLQSRIDRPFRRDQTIFDLEKRFRHEEECRQMILF